MESKLTDITQFLQSFNEVGLKLDHATGGTHYTVSFTIKKSDFGRTYLVIDGNECLLLSPRSFYKSVLFTENSLGIQLFN